MTLRCDDGPAGADVGLRARVIRDRLFELLVGAGIGFRQRLLRSFSSPV